MSKEERDLRYNLIKAALGHNMGFDANERTNPAYFDYDPKTDQYRLKPGLVADAGTTVFITSAVWAAIPGVSARSRR